MAVERKPVDWEAIEREYRAGEVGVERIAAAVLSRPSCWAEMGWPDVASINRQVRVGRAIVDILVRHVDGSITLVEVKRAGLHLRDYCTGIGQLAYQAVMAMSDFQTFKVRRVLAMAGQFPVDVAIVCAAEDVDMLPMCTVDEWIGFLREAA